MGDANKPNKSSFWKLTDQFRGQKLENNSGWENKKQQTHDDWVHSSAVLEDTEGIGVIIA